MINCRVNFVFGSCFFLGLVFLIFFASFRKDVKASELLINNVEASFAKKILYHPTRISIALRRAVYRLISSPESLLSIGLQPIKMNKARQIRALKYTFKGSKVTSFVFHKYDPLELRGGKVASMTVLVDQVSLDPLILKDFSITMNDVVFDKRKVVDEGILLFTRVKGFSFGFSIEEDNLNHLLGSLGHLRIGKGKLSIYSLVKMMFVTLRGCLDGYLYIKDGHTIRFRATSFNLGNLPLTSLFKNKIGARLNPLFSLKEYLGKGSEIISMTLKSLSLEQGIIKVLGIGNVKLEHENK